MCKCVVFNMATPCRGIQYFTCWSEDMRHGDKSLLKETMITSSFQNKYFLMVHFLDLFSRTLSLGETMLTEVDNSVPELKVVRRLRFMFNLGIGICTLSQQVVHFGIGHLFS